MEHPAQSPWTRRESWSALAAVVLFYLIIEGMGVTCPIRFLTGVSCAGCGMSRAWLSLLRGDLAAAIRFHPLFWLPVPAAALLLLRRRLPGWAFRLGMGAACVLFLGVYLVRLCAPGDSIVVFQPSAGLFARLFRAALAG